MATTKSILSAENCLSYLTLWSPRWNSSFSGEKIYLEKILRATDVNYVYLLVRPKRGKNIDERINDILKDELFDQLHKLKPNSAKRVKPIFGDCLLPNLGLSSDDYKDLVENVHVVVHSAATVRFNEPLSTALAINVRATVDLIKLAKKMQKLKVFVHVSSAFANCFKTDIDECYYTEHLNITAEKLCTLVDILGTETADRLATELCKDFPNTYCYTKALAEEAILSQGSELPICIFRPGIVIPSCSEPVPGWIDTLYGPTSILYGAAYGVLHVLYANIEANAGVVPVDYCANAMLSTAWYTAKSVRQDVTSPPSIYNLVPDSANPLKWKSYMRSVEEHGTKMPLTNMIWFPFLIHTNSILFYKILCFFYHTIPGYIFDLLLLVLGKKRRLVKTYKKIHQQRPMFDYFVERNFNFSITNSKQLWKNLTPEDQSIFNFDMLSINWSEYFYNSLCGMRRFLAKEEPSTIPRGLELKKRFLILHRAVQLLVYGGGSLLFYWTSKKLYYSI
ncbi:fatty acyl-CoA reductase wat-like [Teleopsis dalmanni]|uniref:fatty acyl-CoA reductase wat-like n=1 Tax=Teleopsis dalmanni TaxID=139649 RepID=UPI0018CC8CA3|nr:fatty acyl-CoA reductase wat-like [Teleopsis dalmanni]